MGNFDAIIQQYLQKVEKQLASNNPPQVKETLDRLQAMGYPAKNAKMMIAQCVAFEMNRAMELDQRYDQAHYIELLQQLPEPPDRDEAITK